MLNTKFWVDSYVINELNPVEKLVFIYLITNTHTNISGIYEIPAKLIAVETGIDRDNLEKVILPKLQKDGKIMYYDGWMAIKNFIKHQIKNPNIEKGIERELTNAPESLVKFINKIDKGSEGFRRVPKGLGNLTKLNLTKDCIENDAYPDKTKGETLGHPEIMKYFHDCVIEETHIAPALNGKDGMAVKRALVSYSVEQIKEIIDFYLESEKVQKFGYNLSTALSKDTINQWIYVEQKLN